MVNTNRESNKISQTFVGIKEFRKDIAKYVKQARTKTSQIVVTSRNKPLFMVAPLEDEVYTEGVLTAVAAAQADVAAGHTYTLAEAKAELGL